ncbi:MAG TPA: hypothetical protein PLV68_10405, partial [Ilumatobacteraceae bacterium]|nr:hypothetical protein [Ilumatobacteraceae bacterium]
MTVGQTIEISIVNDTDQDSEFTHFNFFYSGKIPRYIVNLNLDSPGIRELEPGTPLTVPPVAPVRL